MYIYVLVRTVSEVCGRGSVESLTVAGPSPYGGSVYPVFLSEEEAVSYVDILGDIERRGLEILRLQTECHE